MNHLMDRYAQGDEAAFAALHDELAPRLYRCLLGRTRERAWAEDLLQQTFLQIHCARGRFIRSAEVMPWALAIARRLFIDDVRRRSREVSLGSCAELGEAAARADGPDEVLDGKRCARALARELTTLPPAQREAFALLKLEGLSLAEAAAMLETTVTAVKLRAHRAYQALRACTEPRGQREGLRAA
jgi:RNA polymerase sigma-70 factor (ECF subfamily)